MDPRLSLLFLVVVSLIIVVESKPAVVVYNENGMDLSDHSSPRDESSDWGSALSDTWLMELAATVPKENHGVFSGIKEIFKRFKKSVEDELTSSGLCLSCKLAVLVLKEYVERGATEDGIAKLSREICTFFRIETARVCDGLSQLFKRQIYVVLSKVIVTPGEICGSIFWKTCSGAVNPLHNWTVPMTPFPKPPVKPIPLPKPGSPVTRVLHISDLHLDPYYAEGSLANCNEPLCCRKDSGVPKNASDAAGLWGDYRKCDTPLRTLENVLHHINKTHKVDYVIWTGDIPPHDIWNNSREEVLYIIDKVSKLVDKYLGKVPIFPALGNHESSPVNSFPVPEVKGNDSISWLYKPLYEMWKPWVSTSNAETMQLGAYYSHVISPGFRIISLNMNYCNNLNWWVLINSTDPTGELNWLVKELQLAEIRGEKVHIIGHIPPGNSDCLQVWSRNYFEIVKRYESSVRAQFFGHTHSDDFTVFYDTDEGLKNRRPFGIAYIGPSITTYNSYNPGYRIYTVDGNYEGSTRLVLDHETYIMNLTEANSAGSKQEPRWQLEYTALKAYNMSSLLPTEWDKLLKRFVKDDTLFQKYYRYYVKQSDYYKSPCRGQCKENRLCFMKRGYSGQSC